MNKNIFITGGTSEIGKSLIHKLAKNKCNIFFTYFKNLREAQSISKSLKQYNIHHNYTKMDLTKIVSINNAFNKFSNDFKKLNVFINNASPKIKRKKFLRLKDTDISVVMEGLLIGNIVSLKKALDLILKSNSQTQSTIINISSYSAISGGKNIHLYAASKSALNTLATALSNDTFRRKIKIVSIVPRHIDTLSFRKNNNIKNKKDLILFQKRKKIKRIRTPNEFAKFIYKKFTRELNTIQKPIIYYDSFKH